MAFALNTLYLFLKNGNILFVNQQQKSQKAMTRVKAISMTALYL